ncbi:tail protein X [Salmonella enterica]|nr:phage tail protein [Salmonella enterica subsp. diarizonae]ELB6470222.1 tail protein X [Salmonella enterica]
MVVIAGQGDTVDLICYRIFGQTAGVTEQVYRMNPGLADIGPVLLQGTPVTLPDTITPPQAKTIQLWD